MQCLTSLFNNFLFTSSCFSVSSIFFVFWFLPQFSSMLSFSSRSFSSLFRSVSFSSRFSPFSIILWSKLPPLPPLATSLVFLLICLSALLPITFSVYFPIFRTFLLEVTLFGMLFPFFKMVRRMECTGKLLRNYAIEYDGQNFLKFVSKLLDASIWRIWPVAEADFEFCEREICQVSWGSQFMGGWSTTPSVILAF